jgi:hypothetical protein
MLLQSLRWIESEGRCGHVEEGMVIRTCVELLPPLPQFQHYRCRPPRVVSICSRASSADVPPRTGQKARSTVVNMATEGMCQRCASVRRAVDLWLDEGRAWP